MCDTKQVIACDITKIITTNNLHVLAEDAAYIRGILIML